jgi:2-dehydropantoate 2-reductase
VKICIFGAGAIGSFLAAALADGGAAVSAVARGAHLAAMRANGVTVRIGSDAFRAAVNATDDPNDLGPQDIVLVTLKAPGIAPAVDAIAPLLKGDTSVVFVLNGIPWWYYYRHGGAHDGRRIKALDPDGRIWDEIGPHRVLGAIAYCSATIVAPGLVSVAYPEVRFEFGEPDGTDSPRLQALLQATRVARLRAVPCGDIRPRIWSKILLNLATGPMAVLSGAALADLFAGEATRHAARTVLTEGLAITKALGFDISLDIDAALARVAESRHKPSILQDLERGRPMEIGALYGVPLDIARESGVSTPLLRLMVDLVKLRATQAGLYPG